MNKRISAIHIENTGTVIKATPAVSLLNTLLRNGIPINHKCGGKMQCGTCVIKIAEGMNYCSPISEDEKTFLLAHQKPEGYRLACQTFISGPVKIRI
jgi:ferredoxin, 2Fe-2S